MSDRELPLPDPVAKEIDNAAGFLEHRARQGMTRAYRVGEAHGAARAALELGAAHAGPLKAMVALTPRQWALLAELAAGAATRFGGDEYHELEGLTRGIALAMRKEAEDRAAD
jgi:hypothetical protein